MISLDLVRMSVEAGMGKSYRELVAWQKAMLLVTEIYLATKSFPQEERYGLTNQLRRAAVSVPSNIAEGAARSGTGEFLQFLGIAKGSLAEVETLLILARKLTYLTQVQAEPLPKAADENGRML